MIKLYDQNVDKIKTYKKGDTVVFDGANMYVEKLTEVQLNSIGLYYVEIGSAQNRRYYTVTQTRGLVGNKFIMGYDAVAKPIDQVRDSMLKDLTEAFSIYSKRPKVDTGLGYFVDGGRSDKDNFKEQWEDMLDGELETIKDADNNFIQNVSKSDMHTIYKSIVAYAKSLFTIKWQKELEIQSLSALSDCILYEATPYDYIVTQEDVDADIDGGLTVGQVLTRYKNNVKEW